jgi:hypothetical protein
MQPYRRWILALACCLVAVPALSGDLFDPRSLPTVVKVWGRRIAADQVVVRGAIAYVRSGGRLTALDARSGRELWSRTLGEEACCRDNLLVTADTVAAGADAKLFLLEAKDGSVRAEVDLGGSVSRLAGPPIVAAVSGGPGGNELVAVDAASGMVRNRVSLGAGGIFDLAVVDGYAVANLAGEDVEQPAATVGYAADGLRELWRRETASLPAFARIQERLYLEIATEDSQPDRVFQPIDPASGELGKALPARRPSALDAGWPWELQSVAGSVAAGTGEGLRRNDLESGRPVWTVELPGQVRAVAKGEGVLYVELDRGGGRGLLATIDWATGDVRQLAYGLPRSHAFQLAKDLLIVVADGEVAAFSATEVGPPEAATRSIAAEVRRILLDNRGDDSALGRGEPIADRVRELDPLGAAAYPAIASLLPVLGPTSLVAASEVLAAGAYRPAAAPLARRLAGKLEEPVPGQGRDDWNPQFAALRALAALGGDAEVPAVAAVLESRTRRGAVRREALATLAAMRSPAAERELRDFLSRPVPHKVAWTPPSPRADGGFTAELPGGRSLLFFHDGYIGSADDLWVTELDREGRVAGSSRFTGVRLPRTEAELRARVEGDLAEIRNAAGTVVARLSLSRLDVDSDGDGLTDLVEQRLRLDPHNPDSDGDGLSDAEDPAPNARMRAPVNQEQEIAAAVFRQYFLFDDDAGRPREVAIMVSDFALEWSGRRDATITLNAREAERFQEEVGRDGGIPLISIRRGDPLTGGRLAAPRATAAGPDEDVYTLTIDRGPGYEVTYRVVVRNLNAADRPAPPLWVIRELRTH